MQHKIVRSECIELLIIVVLLLLFDY